MTVKLCDKDVLKAMDMISEAWGRARGRRFLQCQNDTVSWYYIVTGTGRKIRRTQHFQGTMKAVDAVMASKAGGGWGKRTSARTRNVVKVSEPSGQRTKEQT